MSAQERRSIWISLEKETNIEFRKILFKNGISSNELFAYIVELININDERVLSILKDVKKLKIEKIAKGEVTKYNSDNLYDAIEEMLKK